jgi:hypothetical protein
MDHPVGQERIRPDGTGLNPSASHLPTPDEGDLQTQMHVHWSLRLHRALWQDSHHALRRVAAGGAMTSPDAVHRTIVVVDIAESTHPIRTDDDRLVIREAMYGALEESFGRGAGFRRPEWQRCHREDRGDGVLVLVPPDVPKARLVTTLPQRLEIALGRHNAAEEEHGAGRASATQVRLRVAVHAGEVTFDKHGVVGSAIDHTFRLVDAPPLKAALAGSLDACVLIVSDWFYSEVVRQRQQARPDTYRHVGCEVKGTRLSAWMRIPGPRLALERTALLTANFHPPVTAEGSGHGDPLGRGPGLLTMPR